MPDKKVVMDMVAEHAEQNGTTRDKLLKSKGWTQAKHLPKIWDFLMAMQGKHAHWAHHADMLKDESLARKLQQDEKDAWRAEVARKSEEEAKKSALEGKMRVLELKAQQEAAAKKKADDMASKMRQKAEESKEEARRQKTEATVQWLEAKRAKAEMQAAVAKHNQLTKQAAEACASADTLNLMDGLINAEESQLTTVPGAEGDATVAPEDKSILKDITGSSEPSREEQIKAAAAETSQAVQALMMAAIPPAPSPPVPPASTTSAGAVDERPKTDGAKPVGAKTDGDSDIPEIETQGTVAKRKGNGIHGVCILHVFVDPDLYIYV